MERSDRIVVVTGTALLLFLLSGSAYVLEPPLLAVTLSALATASMFTVLAFGLVALRPGSEPAVRDRLGLATDRLPWPALLLAVTGTMALSNLLEAAIAALGLSEVGSLAELDAGLAGARGAGLAGALLSVALASGAAEELFFRGYAQRGLERRLAGRRAGGALALLLASAAFAAAHFDPIHSTAAFVLGLYLGGVTRLADSVWPAAACHVVNNAAAVLDAAYGFELPPPGALRVVLELALVAASLLAVARLRRPGKAAPPPALQPSAIDPS